LAFFKFELSLKLMHLEQQTFMSPLKWFHKD